MTFPVQSDEYAVQQAHQEALRRVLIQTACRAACVGYWDRHGETVYDRLDPAEAAVLVDHLMPTIAAYIETHYQPRSAA